MSNTPGANPNIIEDFEFEVNLSGLVAPTGNKAPEAPEGFYKVLIENMYINKEKNENRCVMKNKVLEGPSAGSIIWDGINRPKDAGDPVRYYWRALAESVGYTSAQLDSGAVRLGPAAFKNRTGFVYHKPQILDENGIRKAYASTTWLVEDEWNRQKAAWETIQANKTETPSTEEGSDSHSNGKPNHTDSVSKSDIMKTLGLA